MKIAVIIDDNEKSRKSLKKDIEHYAPNIKVIGEAEGVVSGSKLLNSLNPDVVFLDIDMQDGTGFDLLDIQKEINFKVIFTTAHNEYALNAFKYAAVDYLLKPVDPDLLMKAALRLNDFSYSSKEQLKILNEAIKSPNQTNKKLGIPEQNKTTFYDVKDIVRLEGDGNYSNIYVINSGEKKGVKKITTSKNLSEFEEILKTNGFFRVHKSHLVNTSFIKEFIKDIGPKLKLTTGDIIEISERKLSEVKKMLDSL